MSVCRVHNPTTDAEARMFKYAARHWAHFRCWLWARVPQLAKPLKIEHVVRLLSTLHVHELNQFPVMALSELVQSYGLLDEKRDGFVDVVIVMRAAIKIAAEREARVPKGRQGVGLASDSSDQLHV